MIRQFGMDKIGFFLGRIRRPRVLRVGPLYFQMNPEVSSCFPLIISGRFNEEETHKFLEKILSLVGNFDLFVDVGSNIGEFIIDMASSGKVTDVVGFEPNSACVRSSTKSVELNRLKNVRVVQTLLKESAEQVKFDMSGNNAYIHSIFSPPVGAESMRSSTLDNEIQVENVTAVLLIDVEGAEVLVMAGGKNFIKRNLPLIIFEYNHVSKLHFTLEDVREVLPAGYEIFRLRMGEGSLDGYLDRRLEQTYNCVAVHKDSRFYQSARELVK